MLAVLAVLVLLQVPDILGIPAVLAIYLLALWRYFSGSNSKNISLILFHKAEST